MEQNPHYTGGS